MSSQMPQKLKLDLIKLLKDSVLSYRVKELRECIETYNRRPLNAPHKSAKKSYLLQYVTKLLDEMGLQWKGVLPLRYVTKILELECRARNDFVKRYHHLNTSLDRQPESPFYQVKIILCEPVLVHTNHVRVFKIPFNWSHVFTKEWQQVEGVTYEIQILFEPLEGEEWIEIPIRIVINDSFQDRLELQRASPIVYLTKFLRDPKIPDALTNNRHKLLIDFPSGKKVSLKMSIRLVKRISVSQLLKSNPIAKTCRLAYLLDDFFERSGFMACTVSLFSTFDAVIMDIPCRGSGCSHPDVFDLKLFLRQAQFRLRWACPVCLKELEYSTLEVDRFFESFRELSGKLNYTFKKEKVIPFERGHEICTITLE